MGVSLAGFPAMVLHAISHHLRLHYLAGAQKNKTFYPPVITGLTSFALIFFAAISHRSRIFVQRVGAMIMGRDDKGTSWVIKLVNIAPTASRPNMPAGISSSADPRQPLKTPCM